jgi:hypothetical protein
MPQSTTPNSVPCDPLTGSSSTSSSTTAGTTPSTTSAFHQSEYEHFQHVEYIAWQQHEQHDVYYSDRDQFDEFHARKIKRSSLPGAFPADATPSSC